MTTTIEAPNKTTLEANRSRLQAEQHTQRQQLATWRDTLATLTEQRREYIRQYDMGVDTAGEQASQCLDEITTVEAAIAKLERELAEYPQRIHNLNVAIDMAGHRDRLRDLLQVRRDEVEAFYAFEQTALTFWPAYHHFQQLRTRRRSLCRSLQDFATANKLPSVEAGDFPAPGVHDVELWLNMNAQQIEARIDADFTKGKARIESV